jgi:UDP-N-acetylglucosamine 2-epimerase
LVHGDTTTSSMVTLAFHLGIKVGHVEAGLWTYDKQAPFEEINRQITSSWYSFYNWRLKWLKFVERRSSKNNILKLVIP